MSILGKHHDHTWLGSDRLLARTVGRPLGRFLSVEAAGGILLLAATAVALIWANSPWKDAYVHLFEATVLVEVGTWTLELTVHEVINDGLMAVFFFVVGIEIKRELVLGELRNPRAAALPIIGALGGMVVPALIYFALNAGTDASHGWGIPMATDIAFAVGVVALLGSRVPTSLKLFLLTLAIVDDLGAIAVIAVFYSDGISLRWLAAAVLLLLFIYGLHRVRVWYLPVYVVLGLVVWYFLLRSGVHATIAGVALGLLTPIVPLRGGRGADDVVHALDGKELTVAEVRSAAFLLNESVSVGDRLVEILHPWTSFVIIPLFALANAGVPLSSNAIAAAASSPVTLGVALGLVVGKTVGVAGAALLATKLRLAVLPRGVHVGHIVAIALMAGIGFTVSLFVTGLAFDDVATQDEAKVGVLGASVVAALGGAALFWVFSRHSGTLDPDLLDDDVTDEELGLSAVPPASPVSG